MTDRSLAPSTLEPLLARFEDLLSKATPAPWHWTGSGDAYHEAREGKPRADYDYEGEMHSPHVCDGPPGWPNCRQDDVHFDSPVMVCQTDGGVYVHNDVDFQLWEAARNDLPALLAHLRAQEAALRAFEDWYAKQDRSDFNTELRKLRRALRGDPAPV